MKHFVEKILAFITKRIIKKYHPKVIGITGSVGKSSTKEALFTVISGKFRVRRSEKNYNNEIGVPVTVIGTEPAGKSVLGWLRVFWKGMMLLVKTDKNYPEVLILEYGADKPGDITYLTTLVPCAIGVVTKVAPAHVEAFGSVEKIAKEKRIIVSHLEKEGFAILNSDDERVVAMAKVTKAQIITFGFGEQAMVRASRLDDAVNEAVPGIRFKVGYNGSTVPMYIPGVFGEHQVYALLAAAAVGVAMGMNLIEIADALRAYVPPRGRMNLIPGIKNTLLVDDTYNSSPVAAVAAVSAVTSLPHSGRLVAVMGDMLELGEMENSEHQQLGAVIADAGFSLLIAVGSQAEKIKQGAVKSGLTNVVTFPTSEDVAAAISDLIQDHDVVLVKGSQGVRMERVVKALMADPSMAGELLVRQSESWMKK